MDCLKTSSSLLLFERLMKCLGIAQAEQRMHRGCWTACKQSMLTGWHTVHGRITPCEPRHRNKAPDAAGAFGAWEGRLGMVQRAS